MPELTLNHFSKWGTFWWCRPFGAKKHTRAYFLSPNDLLFAFFRHSSRKTPKLCVECPGRVRPVPLPHRIQSKAWRTLIGFHFKPIDSITFGDRTWHSKIDIALFSIFHHRPLLRTVLRYLVILNFVNRSFDISNTIYRYFRALVKLDSEKDSDYFFTGL